MYRLSETIFQALWFAGVCIADDRLEDKTLDMDNNMDSPDMRFRTYLTVDTVQSRTRHYVLPPLTSFCPPVEWELDCQDFKRMISLQDGVFYDTEVAARPKSYVIVPAELTTAVQGVTGLNRFTFINHVSYPCYPARSTIFSQLRVFQGSKAKCVILMPIPNCNR